MAAYHRKDKKRKRKTGLLYFADRRRCRKACKEVTEFGMRGEDGNQEGRVVGKVDSFRKFRHPVEKATARLVCKRPYFCPRSLSVKVRTTFAYYRLDRAKGYDWFNCNVRT